MRGIPFFSSLITVLPSLGEREHTTNSHTKPRRLSRSQLSPSDSPATFSSPNTCRRHRVVCPSSISATAAAADANNSSARRVYIKLHSSIHPFIHSFARSLAHLASFCSQRKQLTCSQLQWRQQQQQQQQPQRRRQQFTSSCWQSKSKERRGLEFPPSERVFACARRTPFLFPECASVFVTLPPFKELASQPASQPVRLQAS